MHEGHFEVEKVISVKNAGAYFTLKNSANQAFGTYASSNIFKHRPSYRLTSAWYYMYVLSNFLDVNNSNLPVLSYHSFSIQTLFDALS